MQRWHTEEALMLRRWREEIAKHRHTSLGYVEEEGCHCLRGKGFMRKRRPWDSCSPSNCSYCRAKRDEARYERRKARRGKRAHIARELQ